ALRGEETWERWLGRAAGAARPALREAIALGVGLPTLRELAEALVRERDLLAGLPPPVAEEFGELNREVRGRVEELAGEVSDRARTAGDRLAQHLDELLAWVHHTETLPEGEQGTPPLTERPFRRAPRLGTQPVWGKERIARMRGALTELGERVAAARAVRLHNLAAGLAGWLAGFVAAYRDRLGRLGLLDFHDLLAITRDLL